MTVEALTPSISYIVTIPAIGTEYPITFPYIEVTDVKAYYLQTINGQGVRTDMTFGVHYTITDRKLVTLAVIPIEGSTKLAIYRNTERSQEILWVDGQAIYAPNIMGADDKLTYIVQELTDEISRTIRTSITDPEPPVSSQDLYNEINKIADRAEAAVVQSEAAANASDTSALASEAARDRAEAAAVEAGNRADEIHNLSIAVKDLPTGEIGSGAYNPDTGMLTLSVPRGRQGEQGIQGVQGETGVGRDGVDGKDGTPGSPGLQGPPGEITGELDKITFGNFRVDENGRLKFAYFGSGTVPAMSINNNGQVVVTLP